MPEPAARILDPVSHNEAAVGFLLGSLAAGVAMDGIFAATTAAATGVLTTGIATTGLAVAGEAALALVGATGGAALVPLAVAGLAIAAGVVACGIAAWGAQKLGAALGEMVPSPDADGQIVTGSLSVRINGRFAAFVTSPVDCHEGEVIASGAATVRINGLNAARVGSETSLGAVVLPGSPNVLIGGPSVAVMAIRRWGLGVEILGDVLTLGEGGIAGLADLAGGAARLAGRAFEGMAGGIRSAAEALASQIGKGFAEAAGDAERGAAAAVRDGADTAAGGRVGQEAGSVDQVGHPVNPATGEVFTEQTDFVLPGPLPLVFARIWVSSSTIAGEIGHGWHHTLDMALRRQPDGRMALRLGDGRFVLFEAPAPGAPAWNGLERLQLWTDGRQHWASSYDGIRYGFGPPAGANGLRRLVRIADANENAISLQRDADGGLLGIVDSAGRRLLVRRDACGRIVGIDAPHPGGAGLLPLVGFEYDADGNLIASRDAAGGTFQYGYERHLLVHERRPAGLCFQFRYDSTARGPAARCLATWGDNGLYERHLAYDDAVRTTTVRSRRGAVERFEWNAMGRVTAHVDALGRRSTRAYAADVVLVSETRADGAARARRFDGLGRVVETGDYDGARRLLRYPEVLPGGTITQLPEEVAGPGGAVQRFDWDGRLNLLRHVDAGGRERRFLRDTRGLTVAVQDALGPLRRFGWTDRGELAWDSAGDGSRRIEFGYDPLGRLSERRMPGEPPTRFVSDAAGRLVEIRRPDGGLIRLTHDAEGHVTSHRDAAGHVTRWVYDGLPYPIRRLNADGTGLLYRYDEDLNLVGLSNAKGEPYTLRYDLADQLVEEIGFDGRRRSYGYDQAGFLAEHGDEEGRGATYRRDRLGRLLERCHADGLADRYAYDAAGALIRAENDWGAVGFAYDAGGLLVEERRNRLAIRHRGDARGRRIATELPDGRLIETAFDARDQVLAVGFAGREVAAFRRDALGRETARRAGGLTTLSDYDPQGRLARQTGRSREAREPVIERAYRWDEADRLVETHDLARGMRRYQYDACERLVGVAGDHPESFVIDPAGNILGSDADGGTGAAIGDRLLIRGDAKFEYDNCGNRIRELRGAGGNVERLYRYRADNQLAEVEERSRRGRRVTSFAYDALGRRTEKRSTAWGPVAANDATAPSATTKRTDFVWSGGVLLAESSTTAVDDAPPTDPLATIYLHEPGSFRPLAQVRRATPGGVGTVFHYQLDHLGTPQEVTNDDGRIVWQARLKAWGAVARMVVEEVAQPIRFQGQYHDAETGLHYNRFRYYAPDDGCYVHQDPIRLAGGANAATYVSAPTHATDPLGLCAVAAPPRPDFYVGSDGTTMPSTAYRYMDSSYAAQTMASGKAPLSYFGFTKFESGAEARDAFQVYYQQGDPASWSDARLRGEFDTLQLFNADGSVNARVPLMNGDKGPGLEPFTSAYPQYGSGGEQQLVPVTRPTTVDFSDVTLLPEK